MINERIALRGIPIFLLLALALCVPAAAQETVTLTVQPDETIEVGSEPLVLDLFNLRNTTMVNPITELRHYQDDDPAKQIVWVIAVPTDDYFPISDYALGGTYGRYFPYSKKDGLIEEHSIIFAPAPATTGTLPTETSATAAQETVTLTVQPGETIEVGSEPLILDLFNLRNTTMANPITELRHYQDDDPTKQIAWVIAVPTDDYFPISDYALGGTYGRYFPYSEKDGLIEEHSIVFAPAPAATGTLPTGTTATTAEATETPAATTATTPTTTQAPLPGLIAIAAIGICGLLAAAGRK